MVDFTKWLILPNGLLHKKVNFTINSQVYRLLNICKRLLVRNMCFPIHSLSDFYSVSYKNYPVDDSFLHANKIIESKKKNNIYEN